MDRGERHHTRAARRLAARDGRRRGRRWATATVVVAAFALIATAVLWPHRLAETTPPEETLGLALPAVPAVADPAAAAAAVAPAAPVGGLDVAAVRRALAPALATPELGPRVMVAVAPLDGSAAYRSGPAAVIPASTTKLLTSAAALVLIPAGTTFATTTVRSGRTLTLVGGGDPLLTIQPQPDAVPARADLTTLAERTAAALRRDGVTAVRLRYDASLFTGPALNPTWPAGYTGNPGGFDVVSPISALWVDEGRTEPGGAARVADPAATAADRFAAALKVAGVRVSGTLAAGRAAEDAVPVAAVESAPVAEQVEHLLEYSDNEAAEAMLRQVGLAASREGSTAAGLAGVASVLRRLDVPLPERQLDGSGLSRRDLIGADTFVALLRAVATASADSPLRSLLDGLPVAGFSGSLAARFDQVAPAGRGVIRAKTGTLTGVSGYAGVGADADGIPFVFVIIADRVRTDGPGTLEARAALDRAAAALATCRCGSAAAG